MSRDGNGTYSLPEAPFVFNTVIDETAVNNNFSDIASALTGSLAKDGQTVPTANLPMGNFKHTGVGNGTARNHYASVAQVQDGAVVWGGTAGGTADALTINLSPAITAYATGMTIQFIASADSTSTTPTINVNGAGTKTIVGEDGSALGVGDIVNGTIYSLTYDGTDFRISFSSGSLGTAAFLYAGTSAGDLVQVGSGGSIPASVSLPVGSLFYWPADTPPSWALERDGSAISRTTYAALFAIIGTTYGSGDGSTTFNLPDDRANAIRGWDNGRGVDSGRIFGSEQLDQMQQITGTINEPYRGASNVFNPGDYIGAFTGRVGSKSGAGGISVTNNVIDFDSANSPGARVGDETRMRNRAYLPCIKY